ncbi:MAG: RDD family protein [Akkermansiaceae bacterium]|nr:RDD family protein [Akkermansiaceae bacterium]
MKVWHYAIEDVQTGPVSSDEVERLLQQGTLTQESLIWQEGMPDWMPVRAVPVFAQAASPYLPPSVDSNEAVQWDNYEPTGSQTRPWIRFWARMGDLLLVGMLFGIVAAFVYPAYEETSDYISNILVTALMVPAEAVMLAVFGTTPCKALFNIRIRNQNGTRLDFREALLRSVRVWIRGAGLGLPLISLITYFTGYKSLSERGFVSWDREGGHVLSHRIIEWWRILVILMAFVGLVALIGYTQEQGLE